MKMCLNCNRMNQEKEEVCIECVQNKFVGVIFPPEREREEE